MTSSKSRRKVVAEVNSNVNKYYTYANWLGFPVSLMSVCLITAIQILHAYPRTGGAGVESNPQTSFIGRAGGCEDSWGLEPSSPPPTTKSLPI